MRRLLRTVNDRFRLLGPSAGGWRDVALLLAAADAGRSPAERALLARGSSGCQGVPGDGAAL
ncbi:hypothetical protein ACGGAQ_13655 [Micromonospora sp. NPDC047557]|uniref:hypothetical protein n=1 Tax=Micromonospora sp. NPDC047557 TaxID=3364250 RepID=UPI00371BA2BA